MFDSKHCHIRYIKLVMLPYVVSFIGVKLACLMLWATWRLCGEKLLGNQHEGRKEGMDIIM
jgi:hypothetical protein